MIRCEEVSELLAAYALDALPDDERAEVSEHLSSCDRHPELAELQAVGASLPHAAPEMAPPPALKSRIMAEVRGQATRPATERPAREGGGLRGVVGLFRSPSFAYGLSAVLAAIVVALGVWVAVLQSEDGAATYTLSGPAGVSGELVVSSDEVAVITVAGLDPLPAGQTYQVWIIDADGRPVHGGFLGITAEGEAVGTLVEDVSGASAVAVTVEPAGGSEQPTSDPIVSGEL